MARDPRYDGPPLIDLDLPADDPTPPLVRQRTRLAEALAGLDEAAWATPSRCARWSVQDVVSHLVDVNRFWALSIAAGRRGEPTRYLEAFDPVETPAQLVAATRGVPPTEVLARFVESNDALAASLEGVEAGDWSDVRAEGPPGHISLRGIARHALWDGWVHERDVLVPLGVTPEVEDDEVVASLSYVAGLGPAFLIAAGRAKARRGSYVVAARDPDATFVVELADTVRVHAGAAPDGAPVLAGPAVGLLEAMSVRAPLDLADVGDGAWMFSGLVDAFRRT
jgi:uncharacterized protein (TIGR03083 family)